MLATARVILAPVRSHSAAVMLSDVMRAVAAKTLRSASALLVHSDMPAARLEIIRSITPSVNGWLEGLSFSSLINLLDSKQTTGTWPEHLSNVTEVLLPREHTPLEQLADGALFELPRDSLHIWDDHLAALGIDRRRWFCCIEGTKESPVSTELSSHICRQYAGQVLILVDDDFLPVNHHQGAVFIPFRGVLAPLAHYALARARYAICSNPYLSLLCRGFNTPLGYTGASLMPDGLNLLEHLPLNHLLTFARADTGSKDDGGKGSDRDLSWEFDALRRTVDIMTLRTHNRQAWPVPEAARVLSGGEPHTAMTYNHLSDPSSQLTITHRGPHRLSTSAVDPEAFMTMTTRALTGDSNMSEGKIRELAAALQHPDELRQEETESEETRTCLGTLLALLQLRRLEGRRHEVKCLEEKMALMLGKTGPRQNCQPAQG
jgi:hypothetical protein